MRSTVLVVIGVLALGALALLARSGRAPSTPPRGPGAALARSAPEEHVSGAAAPVLRMPQLLTDAAPASKRSGARASSRVPSAEPRESAPEFKYIRKTMEIARREGISLRRSGNAAGSSRRVQARSGPGTSNSDAE
jgi:hypothetical protein